MSEQKQGNLPGVITADPEAIAMTKIDKILKTLADESRLAVVAWIVRKHGPKAA